MKLHKNFVITGLSKKDIFFKNFRGEASQYNAKGKRNFQIRLDDPNACYKYGEIGREEVFDVSNQEILNGFVQLLLSDGWHVKIEMPSEQWEGRVSLKVNVNIREFDPNGDGYGSSGAEIYMLNSAGQAFRVDANFMPTLDRNLIEYADVHIAPYNYNEADGKNDQSAYLRHMYFRFAVTNPFANMYKQIDGDPANFEAPVEMSDEVTEMPFC